MLAMVSLGVGEILGGLMMGFIVDRIGSKKTALLNVILVLFSVVIVLIFIIRNRYGPLAFIMTFVWGF
jgi:predicted MFS family arabinose efflux permease